MSRVSRRRLDRMIQALEAPIRAAFLQVIEEARTRMSATTLAGLLERGQIDAAIRGLGIDAPAFSELAEAVRAAYHAGGIQGASEFPKIRVAAGPGLGDTRVALRFNMRNPRAEDWLSSHSARLVTRIGREQADVIRIVLEAGMAAGRNPRQTALHILDPRHGSVLGLTPQQAGFVVNARAELLDPERMGRYFTRQRRDRRFDEAVRIAMAEGRPLSPTAVDRILAGYSRELLEYRAEMIARTESAEAFGAARHHAFEQAIDEGLARPEHIRKVWSATMDKDTRESHQGLDGQEVGLDDVFISSLGSMMEYPGDTEHGADAADTIHCRCQAIYRVDMIAATMERAA